MRKLAHKPADQLPPATPAMLALGRALGALMAADGDLGEKAKPGHTRGISDEGSTRVGNLRA